ncbi:Extracellular metalloproteinase 3 [Metarhizium rileyi]|uniref:Extracellular metalloproteinase 3 n=1 Tax=Metarhizium rileyi (strain RCEF 4871) TaxID=1649241 RepID=A0A162LR50_METRR|nr:Extracellular metalloproteinase 3 [Metarhizium rileyi RCEF 4871]
MSATDALLARRRKEPPLSEGERKICRDYGGWTNFMHSMGLKPTDADDVAEAKAIIEIMAHHE